MRKIRKKRLPNPLPFINELNALINQNVWIYVFGKVLRISMYARLTNRHTSELFDHKKQPLQEQGYVAIGLTGEHTEIFFTPSMVESIEGNTILITLNNTFGKIKEYWD